MRANARKSVINVALALGIQKVFFDECPNWEKIVEIVILQEDQMLIDHSLNKHTFGLIFILTADTL
jgi:hypothetical protein